MPEKTAFCQTLYENSGLNKVSPRSFYRIRFSRIAPLLFLILFILSILHLAHTPGFAIPPAKATLPRALFAATTFHLNWLEAVRGYLPPNWDVLWSLSVEEVFYFFFPLVCAWTRARWGKPLFLLLLLLFIGAGPFARTIWTNNEIWREKSYLGGMDGIAAGCISALLVAWLGSAQKGSRNKGEWWFKPLQLLGATTLLFVAIWHGWAITKYIGRSGLDGSLLALGTCAIAIPAALKDTRGWTLTTTLRWLGRNSYEVYMTHEFVVVWGVALYGRFRSGPQGLWITGIAVISGVLGLVVSRGYSEPLNTLLRARWRNRGGAQLRELVKAL